eukprot:CAMPEP_0194247492 /NCGR_PEP_ID=MMETSP0158-20130606/16654_1 /TAXON_ID=33649 /ORGANISM="Thalassionema nitzschioides, Strain L26-B" /LENGTH=253 /DNA_ID=CAMNT_0038983597 /DNA_START=56 /DNA_END=817 /DNA_ORIENTATION=-
MNSNMISPIQPNSNLMISPIQPRKCTSKAMISALIPRFSPVTVNVESPTFDSEYRRSDEETSEESEETRDNQEDTEEEQRRQREEEESEALARQLMEEEALASYNQTAAFLQDNAGQYSEEDMAAMRAIMEEEENFNDEEANAMDDSEMTYETLLHLGERIGDVKSERWALKAKKEISKLPSLKFCKETMAKGKDENDCGVKCLVCQFPYEESENVRKLPCGHYFHDECIDQWLSAKDFCPYCRTCIVTTEGN